MGGWRSILGVVFCLEGDGSLYKLLAIDMDGTLLNERHEVSPAVLAALDAVRERGIRLVLCSGRPIAGMRPYLAELGLMGPDDYAIGYNGAYVERTAAAEVLFEYTLSLGDVRDLYELSLRLGSPMHIFADHALYTPNKDINEFTINEAFLNGLPLYYRTMDELDSGMSYQKVLFIDDPESLAVTRAALPRELYDRFTIVQSAPHFLEFIPSVTSKGHAVKRLAEALGVKREEVMTFGDNENDLSMLEYAGCGVAMGNAVDAVKSVADFETRSNTEDGVAYAIQQLILDK